MSDDVIDYTTYDLDELKDSQRHIDRTAHPLRAAQIDLLIRDRLAQADRLAGVDRQAGASQRQPARPPDRSKPEPLQPSKPSKPWSTKKRVLVGSALFGLVVASGLVGAFAIKSALGGWSVTRKANALFGEQYFISTLAHVELHQTRYGTYPEDLDDLKFLGEWDQGYLQAVRYCTNDERSAYYFEVERGFSGKPEIELDDEVFQGTGFDADLGPCR